MENMDDNGTILSTQEEQKIQKGHSESYYDFMERLKQAKPSLTIRFKEIMEEFIGSVVDKKSDISTDPERRCFVCGSPRLENGFVWLENENDDLDTTKYLCIDCARNGLIVANKNSKQLQEEDTDSLKRFVDLLKKYSTEKDIKSYIDHFIEYFVEEYGWKYFEEKISGCYNPNSRITFNFKKERIYIKESPFKGHYRVVKFSDVQNCVIYPRFNTHLRRTLKILVASYLFNGRIVSFRNDNISGDEYEFEKLVDCFGWVLKDRNEKIQDIGRKDDGEIPGEEGF